MFRAMWRMASRAGLRTGGPLAGLVGRAVLAAALVLVPPRAAVAQEASVNITAEAGYGRMVLNFASETLLPKYTISTDNGVLVLTFDDPVKFSVDRVPSVLGQYVMIARGDPEGRGARFALARGVRVNTMAAGPKLFIDFLPAGWSGPPPRLPDDVIAELAKRADEAARAARELELLKIAGSKSAKLDINVAVAPTFSRFTFRWNIPYEAQFNRQDSGVSLRFNRKAPVDLSPIRTNMPPFVDDIASEVDAEGLTILLSCSRRRTCAPSATRIPMSSTSRGRSTSPARCLVGRDPSGVSDGGSGSPRGHRKVQAPGLVPAPGAHGAPADHGGAASQGPATPIEAETKAPHGAPDHAPADHAAAPDHGAPSDHAAPSEHASPATAAADHAASAEAPPVDAHAAPTEHGAPAAAEADMRPPPQPSRVGGGPCRGRAGG